MLRGILRIVSRNRWKLLGFLILSGYIQYSLKQVEPQKPKIFADNWTQTGSYMKNARLLENYAGGLSELTNRSAGCTVPYYSPWNTDVLQFVKQVPQLICSDSQRSLLYIIRDTIHYNQTALNEIGYSRASIACYIRYIHYVSNDVYEYTAELSLSTLETKLSGDYNAVYAYCLPRVWRFTRLLLPMFTLPFLPFTLYRNILIYVPSLSVRERREDEYSVVTLVIDALSQHNLYRSLPATVATLSELGGLVFKKHHKTGHNSFPNVMALLSGLRDAYFPDDPNRREFIYLDEEFQETLLTSFEKFGYLTMSMEDYQHMGDFNRKGRIGLRKPLTKVYYRAAFTAMRENLGFFLNYKTGKGDGYGCLGEQPLLNHQLRLLSDFMKMYKNSPYFVHLHLSEYTHDDLNGAKIYDKALKSFLVDLHSLGALNNTFFFILGDHGFQRGEHPFTQTNQGRLENLMAACALLPPTSFSTLHPNLSNNLVQNSEKLTSHYDVNQMLRDLLIYSNASAEDYLRNLEGHGQSLLSSLEDRGCQEAEILPQFCTCTNKEMKIDNSDSSLISFAKKILEDKQQTFVQTGFCQQYLLNYIKDPKLRIYNTSVILDMQLVLKNKEGCVFDVSVHMEGDQIVRLNMIRMDWYSSTSMCLPAEYDVIKPYCICID